MYMRVDFWDFRDAFVRIGRGNQFSEEALEALFSHLEDLEADLGEEMELDVIALCCDYTEYKSQRELEKELGPLEDVQEETTVISLPSGGYIVQDY